MLEISCTGSYALSDKTSAELERVDANGAIEKVQYTEWAAPIVPCLKLDNSVSICCDYIVTEKNISKLDQYLIPNTRAIFAEMDSKSTFTKRDLSDAYTQISLEEDSTKFITISTYMGIYQYSRLCYGISSRPCIFQGTMDNIFQGTDHYE